MTKKKSKAAPKTISAKRVSKGEWLSMALETLETEGVSGVRIEKLARQLGIAKSGFYWHFKNRQDLMKQMLEYWAHEYTAVVTLNKDSNEGTAEQRLENIMRMIRDYRLTKFEAVIFVWAQHDPIAKKTLKQVYKMRLGFIRNLFAELGFKGDELDMRAQLFVGYMAWEYTLYSDQPKTKQNKLLKLRLQLLVKK